MSAATAAQNPFFLKTAIVLRNISQSIGEPQRAGQGGGYGRARLTRSGLLLIFPLPLEKGEGIGEREGTMEAGKLIWIPRVLAIAFIVFISLFALDAFSGGDPLMRKLEHFLIQLIPSFILALVLLIAWRKPLLGGSLFIFLGIAFAFLLRSYRSSFPVLAYRVPWLWPESSSSFLTWQKEKGCKAA